MRAVIQRVIEASVSVDGQKIAQIGKGLLVLVGIQVDDTEKDVEAMTEKICGLRCFPDEKGKFNRSIEEVGGEILIVSQFTLLGDCRKGRRPSFTQAAPPEKANFLYESLRDALRKKGIFVTTGVFGAHMKVMLVNDGPVTLLIDTKRTF